LAAQVSVLRRLAPSRLFDRQIRKVNKLAGRVPAPNQNQERT
jgi:hypothetical protein